MTNYESIDPDIVKEIFAKMFAINKHTLEITNCIGTGRLDCLDCFFYSKSCNETCNEKRKKWLDQPAFDWDKDIDWEKVPVDTPVIVKNHYDPIEYRRYFKGKDHFFYITFDDGNTSWSAYSEEDNYEGEKWYICRLARQEDVEKYRKKGVENG